MFSAKEIIDVLKIHPSKVKNIYLYGSRVYGTCNETSDYDFIVVANSSMESSEYKIGEFNIHVHTPDKFKRDLFDFKAHTLECIYAPDFAKIQEKVKYDIDFNIKNDNLINNALSQSFNSFRKAKRKIENGYMLIGKKSLFHSFRILDFTKQILENSSIVDFSSVNHIWSKIQKDDSLDWLHYRNKYMSSKIEYEKKLKIFIS